jgi:hypothetical protein
MINMKKIIKYLILIVLVPLIVSCRDTDIYRGNDPELHSVALESIIGSRGYEMNEVLRVEEDAYGRVLFAFFGDYIYTKFSGQEDVLAIVIAQKTDGDFVYYYDSMNALAVVTIHQLYEGLTLNLIESYFDEEDFEELKEKNDWNKPINDKLLFRTEVSRKKTCDVHPRELRPYEYLLEGDANYNFTQCYGNDRNGYILVSVLTELTSDRTGPVAVYLMIINQDHELVSPDAVMRVTDIFDSEAIKRFKQENGWSFENQDGP